MSVVNYNLGNVTKGSTVSATLISADGVTSDRQGREARCRLARMTCGIYS